MRRIVVTGMGVVSPLGTGTEAAWARLIAGQSGLRRLPADLARGGVWLRFAFDGEEGRRVALDDAPPRIGFTATKKIGNAVMRNRAKRRLRALAREILPDAARPGWDYVLVGRPEATATRDFALLRADLEGALRRVHAAPEPTPATDPGAAPRRRGGR